MISVNNHDIKDGSFHTGVEAWRSFVINKYHTYLGTFSQVIKKTYPLIIRKKKPKVQNVESVGPMQQTVLIALSTMCNHNVAIFREDQRG